MGDDSKKPSFWDELKKLMGDLLAAFLIFVLLVFVAGQFYAMYFMRADNPIMMWLPIGLLMVILAYKAIE